MGEADGIIWAVFAGALLAALLVSPDRPRYLRRHWFDLLLVIVPLVGFVRAARAFRLVWALGAGLRVLYGSRRWLVRRGTSFLLLGVSLVVVVAAGLIVAVERDDPHATIHTYGDGLWWALVGSNHDCHSRLRRQVPGDGSGARAGRRPDADGYCRLWRAHGRAGFALRQGVGRCGEPTFAPGGCAAASHRRRPPACATTTRAEGSPGAQSQPPQAPPACDGPTAHIGGRGIHASTEIGSASPLIVTSKRQ
jgi:hypothetical protein